MEIENGENKFVSLRLCVNIEKRFAMTTLQMKKEMGLTMAFQQRSLFFVILFRFRIGRERCGKIEGVVTCHPIQI